MFRRITAVLTLFAMSWHAAAGCWWHHAHGAEEERALGRTVGDCCEAGRHLPQDGHHHAAPGAALAWEAPLSLVIPPAGEPCGNHAPFDDLCFEGGCTFLRTPETQPPAVPGDGGIVVPHIGGALGDLLALVGAREPWGPGLTVLPYLPRCEVTRRWRI